MKTTLHEQLNQQLLTAYNTQLIRYLTITHNDNYTEYHVYLHPHTLRTTIQKLAATLNYKYLCAVEFNESQLVLNVRAYAYENQIATMRHP